MYSGSRPSVSAILLSVLVAALLGVGGAANGTLRVSNTSTAFSGGGGGTGSIPPLSPFLSPNAGGTVVGAQRVTGPLTVLSGGGGAGGTGPLFPTFFSPNAGGSLGVLRLPTLINVTSAGQSSGPWIVHVRSASGATLALASTDAVGDVAFLLPAVPGLKLDVLGSDAIGVPVAAGHEVNVVLN